MVSSKLRHLWIALLSIIGLFLMFVKLPEVQHQLGIFQCELCISHDSPYIPMVGAAYFSLLLSSAFLLPSFPGIYLARGGMIWAILLACGLTYIYLPNVCVICLLGHVCNILIWSLWVFAPHNQDNQPVAYYKERICMMIFGTFAVVAFFACMNITVLIYNLKSSQAFMASGLAIGDAVPPFIVTTNRGEEVSDRLVVSSGETLINFVSPNCPYCKEQLTTLGKRGLTTRKVIAVSPLLESDLIALMPEAIWVEDENGELRKRFKVEGYPTLFVISSEGVITKILPGVSDELNRLE